MSGPAYHGRTHCPGGTDPIPCSLMSSGGAFTTYRDCVASDPTTLHLWPCDDASGDLADVVGTSDLTLFTPEEGYPHYQTTGPFTALPEQTAVENGGTEGFVGNETTFFGPAMPSGTDPFTIQGWIYRDTAPLGAGYGTILSDTLYAINGGDYPDPIEFNRNGVRLDLDVPMNTWTHVRWDYDGTTLRVFQDGVLIDSAAGGSGIAAQGGFRFLNILGLFASPWHGRAALWSLHDGVAGFCSTGGEGGGGDAPADFGMWADGSGGVSWHLAQTANIEDEAVTTDKIDDLNVTSAKLAASSVVAGKIAAGAIVNADVSATADLVVTKLAEGSDGQTLKTIGSTPTWVTVTPPTPADDTQVWMPLTTVVAGDPVLVWDGTDSLIPTLTPI